ncbi:MAG TPA: hypothetical protein VJ850_03180 [Candidatus Limnocylindrales bacterium]|nr:hypothetical protein [Candidatus Limnocylindrales bacterium]
MTIPDDDRFQRQLRSVVRDSAPDAAPPELRERVGVTTSVQPVRAPARGVGWPFVAALGAAIVLAAVLLRPQAPSLQGGPQGSPAASEATAVASLGSRPRSTPTGDPARHPGEVQEGQLLTPTDGVVMNTEGSILITHDGGATWRDITPFDPGQVEIQRTYFFDAAHGWVVTYGGQLGDPGLTIWHTADAGTTWASSTLPDVTAVDWKLEFLTSDIGWLATDPSGESPKPELRWTQDGGSTWSDPIDLAKASGVPQLHDITFFDRDHAVMTGGQTLLFSADGGKSWATPHVSNTDFEIVSGTPHYLTAKVVGPSTAFMVINWADGPKTLGQTIFETVNGGADWVARYGDARHRYWDFIDATHWIALDGETVWTTDDGGTSWGAGTSTGLPVVLDFASPQFVDPLHGWAVASGGPLIKCVSCPVQVLELFKTADGGSTWSLVGDCDASSELAFACPSPGPS